MTCVFLGFTLSPSLRSLDSGRVFRKIYTTFCCLRPVTRTLPHPSPQSHALQRAAGPLGSTASREASTMIRQTGRGQSTPNLASKTILQGHHSDSPAKAQGQGAEG